MLNNSDMPSSPVFRSDGFMARGNDGEKYRGLTKREAFAMAAMKGILSHSFGRGTPDELAIQSIKCADALLSELSK